MKSTEVTQVLKSAIAITKGKGVEHVAIADLEAYADMLQETVASSPEGIALGEAALEEYKANLSSWVSSSQQRHEMDLEMLRAIITVGQSALKGALLINGGAAVALLAFIGKIWGNTDTQPTLIALSAALLSYVFGVLSAAMAAGATYFAQAGYANEFGRFSQGVGRAGHIAAIGFVFGAYYLFAQGSWMAFKAIGVG
ncbi:hypothetical protein [Modicisalibacter luteus]|uniref:Uncharacterized protein n=1 Tax=Modicisalibacter luteus TaxID=453962 RepID=A0ABV7M302_9GAMM|nr:hypothetical protein [Halomonas lutea]GHA85507.1 hypothetical protein GCM10007159_03300 [Halomonas lutea]